MAELVSIITPAFQAQSFILRAVSSVIAQTHAEWELLIIADDGIDYAALLENGGVRDSRIRFLSSGGIRSGPNQPRNVGLASASGNWIAPLDADDVYFPDRLQQLVQAAQATGLALDNGYVVDDTDENRRAAIFTSMQNRDFGFDDFSVARVPLVFLFRRDLIARGWDADIACGADTIFNLRALEAAGRAAYVGQPQHEYRVHAHSICHRAGSERHFDDAYRHTLARLRDDGLGFQSHAYRRRVIQYIEEKRSLNRRFAQAVAAGFTGNYQDFFSTVTLDAPLPAAPS